MLIVVTGLRGMPNVMGGVESHCEELLPRIHRLKPSQEIVAVGRRPYMKERQLIYKGVQVVALPSPKSASLEAIVSTLFGVLYARRRGASVIHIHAIGPGLLAPFARLLGLKVVLTHHGSDYDRGKWGKVAKFMLRAGERLGVMAAHKVIVVSPSLKTMLARRWRAAAPKLCYIPNGTPELPRDDRARREVLQSVGLQERQYVLVVGRLVPEKGIDYLIRSFIRSGRDGVLVIAGAADHESEYSRSVLALASDRVLFIGPQPRTTLRHLYEGAALFVLPSFHEGLPIAALEAAGSGAPCLLSDIGGNLDIGLPPRCYFPVGNEEALASALQAPPEAYSVDPSLVKASFDWDECARQCLAVYQDVQACAAPPAAELLGSET